MSRARYKFAVLCAVAFAALVLASTASARPSELPYGDQTPVANPALFYRGWAYFIPPHITELDSFGPGVTVQPFSYRQTTWSPSIRLAEGSLVYIDGAASMTQMYARPLGTNLQYLLPTASLWRAAPSSSSTGMDPKIAPAPKGVLANTWLPGVLLSPLMYQYSVYSGLHLVEGDRVIKVGGSSINGTRLYVYRGTGASAGTYGLGVQPESWESVWQDHSGRRLCC